MSLFTSAPVQPGAIRPLVDGGAGDYYTKKTKVSQFANANVYPTYGFKIYETAPSAFDERSGHTSVVSDKPVSKSLGQPVLGDIFTPADPEMEKLTDYFTRVVPTQTRSIQATMSIKKYGLTDLLERYIRGKLQDDVNVVNARMAGATEVERQLAMARLQDRYSDFVRSYGSEERLRQALLQQYIGGIPDASVRGALASEIRAESSMGGATPMPLSADVATPAGPVGDVDRATYVEETYPSTAFETELSETAGPTGEESARLIESERRDRFKAVSGRISTLERELEKLNGEAEKIDARVLTEAGQRPGVKATRRQVEILRRSQEIGAELTNLRAEVQRIIEYATDEPQIDLPQADPGLDSGLALGAEAIPAAGDEVPVSTGTFVPMSQREVGIAGGSSRGVASASSGLGMAVPPSARALALASQDIGASQAFRTLTSAERASQARADGGDVISESSIFGSSVVSGERTTDPIPVRPARVSGGAYRGPGRTLNLDI